MHMERPLAKKYKRGGPQLDLAALTAWLWRIVWLGLRELNALECSPLCAQHYAPDELGQAGADAVIEGLATLTPDWIEQRFPS